MKRTPIKKVDEFLQESNAIEGVYDDDSLAQAKVAWDYLTLWDELDVGVVLKVHRILMLRQPLYPNEKGYFREVPVYIGGSQAMDASQIREALTEWLGSMNKTYDFAPDLLDYTSKTLHVIYEGIHPFVDGNGRTGRLFMNWFRLRNGLPLLIIHEGDEQMEYYKWFQ